MKHSKNTFRPKARIIHTIGKGLVTSNIAALIELVKNSYDSDAKNVDIIIPMQNESTPIVIEDDGHGMTSQDIQEKWLIIATENKVNKKSPRGRIFLGSKGVGRCASSKLGECLKIVSKTKYETVTLNLNWDDFLANKFLDEISIFLKNETVVNPQETGTTITIDTKKTVQFSLDEDLRGFNKEKLERDLIFLFNNNEDFNISLNNKKLNSLEEILPEISKALYHYRIEGNISADGIINAQVTVRYNNLIVETINFDNKDFLDLSDLKNFGNVSFDIKAFDRDSDGIKDLIRYYETENMKELLDKIYGISIYRNNFRLRPYGNTDYDWLHLDKVRVQNPSMNLGNNTVYGIINIASENESNLIENSSREGLQENEFYNSFIKKIQFIVKILGQERFKYREGFRINKKETLLEKAEYKSKQIVEQKSIINKEIKEYITNAGVSKERSNYKSTNSSCRGTPRDNKYND